MSNDVTTRSLAETTREAEALIDKQQFQKALDLLQEGRGVSAPADEEASFLYTTGLSLLGLSRLLEATTAFRKSADLFDTAGQHQKRGLALEQAGGAHYARRSFRDALELYRSALHAYKAASFTEGMARAHRSIGNVQVDLGERAAAKVSFEEGRRLYRDLGDQEGVALSVMSAASLLYETEGLAGAVAAYRQCIEGDGCEHHLVLNNLGFLLTLDRHFDEARDYLERAETDLQVRGVNDEDGGLLNLNLGNLAAVQQRYEDAERCLQRALQHFAAEGKTRAIEVVVLANDKQRQDGFEPFLLTDDGLKECVGRLSLAAVHVAQGRLDDALEEGRKAVDLDNQAAYPYVAMGWVYLARGESDDASVAFRKALGKEPNNAQIRKALDLVNPYVSARVGRNDACPCGSGKKFKKCHGGT